MGNIKREQIFNCAHCGNKTMLEILSTTRVDEKIYNTDGEDMGILETYIFFVQCKTCNNVSLLLTCEADYDPESLIYATALYPKEDILDKYIPKIINKSYSEAKKVKKISPPSFVIMIRKSIEALCIDKGAKGKNLNEKLAHLSSMGIIPETLSRMTTIIRLMGNTGAHSSEVEINERQVELINDFFIAIIEYVYVAPDKIKRLEKDLKKR